MSRRNRSRSRRHTKRKKSKRSRSRRRKSRLKRKKSKSRSKRNMSLSSFFSLLTIPAVIAFLYYLNDSSNDNKKRKNLNSTIDELQSQLTEKDNTITDFRNLNVNLSKYNQRALKFLTEVYANEPLKRAEFQQKVQQFLNNQNMNNF